MTSDSLAVESALALAYAHLNRRDRTVQEVRDHLAKRGVQDDVAQAAVDELCDQGYLDDARFARLLVEDKRHLEQWGRDRIRRALIGRGVPQDVADATLVEVPQADAATVAGIACGDPPCRDPESGELERALALLERRFPAGLRGRPESERALGVLLRKGYEYELATDALREHRRRTVEAA
jgi:regulatory protein